jgi:hypothetical protein
MFNLYFFSENDPEVAFDIKDKLPKYVDNKLVYDYVREGEFDTKEEAEDRMNNIGSRWIFYPNACIIEELGDKRLLVGIYMADGFNYILSDNEYYNLRREAMTV